MTDVAHALRVLGLEPGASHEHIRQAYRDLVQVWHPDRFAHDPRLQQKAHDQLKAINAAYAQLKHYRSSSGQFQGTPHERATTPSQVTASGPAHRKRSTRKPLCPPSQSSAVTDQRGGYKIRLVAFVLLAIAFVLSQIGTAHRRTEPGRVGRDNSSEELPKMLPPRSPALSRPLSTSSAAEGQPPVLPDSSGVIVSGATLKSHAASLPLTNGPPPRAEATQKLLASPSALTPPTSNALIVGEALPHPPSPDVLTSSPQAEAWSASLPHRNEVLPGTIIPTLPQGVVVPTPPQDSPYFTVGSLWKDVLRIQGSPKHSTKDSLYYGTSVVLFAYGRVVGWENGSPKLKVKLLPSSSSSSKSSFTLGSTWDEVLTVQGTPDRFTKDSLHYGTSDVFFRDGLVVSWANGSPKLKVQLPSLQGGARAPFTVGSTLEEVLAVQGAPDRMSEDELHYGTSDVFFTNGHVVSWYNGNPKLKVRRAPRQ